MRSFKINDRLLQIWKKIETTSARMFGIHSDHVSIILKFTNNVRVVIFKSQNSET